MAMNAADPHHYSFNQALLPLAVEKQMGIIGMKVPARGRILSSWTQGTMAFGRKDYGMDSNIPFIRIANRIQVDVDLTATRIGGPAVIFKY